MGDINKKHVELSEKIARYVEDHPIEIYIDYRDELSSRQINKILEGESDDVILQIEDDASAYSSSADEDWYWDEAAKEVGCTREEVDIWLESNDGFWPGYYITDSGWSQLLNSTQAYITATMWDVDWNFNNWAYGAPVTYSDVKEALMVLGVNPYEFKQAVSGGSATAGPGQFKGYFPNIPDRVPKVNIKELFDMVALYDGVLNFCLSDLKEIEEILKSDSKNIVFKKGTNVVMYNFGNGAGILDIKLIDDVVVPRKKVEFRNDKENTYGIQECYGFTHSFWKEGSCQSK